LPCSLRLNVTINCRYYLELSVTFCIFRQSGFMKLYCTWLDENCVQYFYFNKFMYCYSPFQGVGVKMLNIFNLSKSHHIIHCLSLCIAYGSMRHINVSFIENQLKVIYLYWFIQVKFGIFCKIVR